MGRNRVLPVRLWARRLPQAVARLGRQQRRGMSAELDDGRECAELPEWGFAIGVCMGVVGSIGINIGQNIQALGLQELPELDRAKPCRVRRSCDPCERATCQYCFKR